MATRNWVRQEVAVRGLAMAREGYEIETLSVEEWSGKHVFVKRTRRPLHVQTMVYYESFVVGERGGIKKLYSRYDAR